MKAIYGLVAILILNLAQTTNAVDLSGQHLASEYGGIQCPAKDFAAFIHKFSDDETIQQAFTKYPLIKQQLDRDAEPEPKAVVRSLSRHQIQFPVIPLSEDRAKRLLEIQIDSVSDINAKVTLSKPDTDYQVVYFFRKTSCWQLERIEDWSL